jgi:hypothetical protein
MRFGLLVLALARGRTYWFSLSLFRIALTVLPISWTWDESMANKALMRWSSARTHSAFSSAFMSLQRFALNDVSQYFVLDIIDLRMTAGRLAIERPRVHEN